MVDRKKVKTFIDTNMLIFHRISSNAKNEICMSYVTHANLVFLRLNKARNGCPDAG
ncbi:hypothetical protein AWA1501_07220 [Lactiplantibacillus pentosus]|nr:hypothetical protein AWA1501_07220 [Lactiplantibacillus pentosus]